MKMYSYVILLACAAGCLSQRSPYAGRRPIGYPEMENNSADGLGNRFGNGETTTTGGPTERLPIEALGDRDLVNRLSKLPIDRQPFWLINWRATEEHRNRPQTYDHNPNSFIESGFNQNTASDNRKSSSILNGLSTNQGSRSDRQRNDLNFVML